MTDIFPGGRLPMIETVEEHSEKVGFKVTRSQSLQLDFAKTLDFWAEALEAHKDEAIAIQSEEVYERYMKYLTGCAKAIPDGLHRLQPVHAGEVNFGIVARQITPRRVPAFSGSELIQENKTKNG